MLNRCRLRWLLFALVVLAVLAPFAPRVYWRFFGARPGDHVYRDMPSAYWAQRLQTYRSRQFHWVPDRVREVLGLGKPAVLTDDPDAVPVQLDLLARYLQTDEDVFPVAVAVVRSRAEPLPKQLFPQVVTLLESENQYVRLTGEMCLHRILAWDADAAAAVERVATEHPSREARSALQYVRFWKFSRTSIESRQKVTVYASWGRRPPLSLPAPAD